MVNKQPEALHLALLLELHTTQAEKRKAAAELRRLHAENEDFRATCDHLTRENAEQIGEIVALKEQRDGLLQALRRIAFTTDATVCNVKWVAQHCRAAIAKATGEAK